MNKLPGAQFYFLFQMIALSVQPPHTNGQPSVGIFLSETFVLKSPTESTHPLVHCYSLHSDTVERESWVFVSDIECSQQLHRQNILSLSHQCYRSINNKWTHIHVFLHLNIKISNEASTSELCFYIQEFWLTGCSLPSILHYPCKF